MEIKPYLNAKKELVDSFLASYFDSTVSASVLRDSMQYSVMAGGKRLRPVLVIASYEACGRDAEEIVQYAAALELIHTYSLIHDDLPSMDNDDLRRGKPTNHKVFGEGMAILAGDALLTEAFYLLTNTQLSAIGFQPSVMLRIIREIAMAAGAHGMVGGQAEDLLAEDSGVDNDSLSFIHSHKTGALITVSVRIGAILAGASEKEIYLLTRYGESIGLAFQIIDDILDIRGDSVELGKAIGSDKRKKKLTFPAIYGIDTSFKKAERLVNMALEALEPFSQKADPLRGIAGYILRRRN
ncbi:MAG: polyprenyl synthetase family protein [Nitrospirota bacterium]